jgi:hypothetical protein
MTRSGSTRSQRRRWRLPPWLRLLGYLAALAGGSVPAVVGVQAMLGPLDLRLGLLIGWLLRSHPEAIPTLPDPTVLGAGAAGVLGLFVVVRTGAARRLWRVGRAAAGALARRLDGLDGPPARRGAAGLDHFGSAGLGVTAATAACWDGSRPQHAWRAREDPTGAIVTVTTITGSVGRASLAGHPCTVCSVGPRLRPGVPYVVLRRDGDVLVVATTASEPAG